MSFARSKKAAPAPQDDGPQITRCAATGCPCRATISLEGGRWHCATHAFAMPSDWPLLTERLRDNNWLLTFIDMLLVDPNKKPEDWFGIATAFWAADPFGAPREFETRRGYEYRMREELRWRLAGEKGPRPEPKDKRTQRAKASGNGLAMAQLREAA